MFLLNFFHEYVQELEKNLFQSVYRNGRKVHSTCNFVPCASQRLLLIVIQHHRNKLPQAKITIVIIMIVSGSKSIQVSCKVKSLNQFMTARSRKRYMKYLGVDSFKDQRVKAVALVADL